MNQREYECPDCGEPVNVLDFVEIVTCPECQCTFDVVGDAEFVDGLWRDRTKLITRDEMRRL